MLFPNWMFKRKNSTNWVNGFYNFSPFSTNVPLLHSLKTPPVFWSFSVYWKEKIVENELILPRFKWEVLMNLYNTFSILIFKWTLFIRFMTLNRVKLGCSAIFIKYLARVVSLIFLHKTLNWNAVKCFLHQILWILQSWW